MWKTLALLGTVAALAVIVVSWMAARRPDTFSVQRSTFIQASAERLFPLINDARQATTWNPFVRKDPSIQLRYEGPAAGPGAAYAFSGNKDVGKGRVTVTGGQAPRRVDMTLDMSEPFACHNQIAFTLEPQGQGTRVTWSMSGAQPFVARLIGLFMDMDRMVGRDFEAGLDNLKHMAEAS